MEGITEPLSKEKIINFKKLSQTRSIVKPIASFLFGFVIFMSIWLIGYYVVEYLIKVKSIPYAMLSGYFVARVGESVANFWRSKCC